MKKKILIGLGVLTVIGTLIGGKGNSEQGAGSSSYQ